MSQEPAASTTAPWPPRCGRRTTRGKVCTRQPLIWWQLPYRMAREMFADGRLPTSCVLHLTDEERALYERVQRAHAAAEVGSGPGAVKAREAAAAAAVRLA